MWHNYVDEINVLREMQWVKLNGEIFAKHCAGEFSLGAQILVKSTLESILPDELAQSAEERNT